MEKQLFKVDPSTFNIKQPDHIDYAV